jgi:hypothetical protein
MVNGRQSKEFQIAGLAAGARRPAGRLRRIERLLKMPPQPVEIAQ